MTKREIQEKAVEAVIAMIAALTNIRLYPATSAIVAKSVDKIYPCFLEIFDTQDTVVYAESEKDLLIEDQPIEEKDRKKPQIGSFLNLMLNLGIKSITIRKGVAEAELTEFLKEISGKPEDIEKEGGIQKKIGNRLPHIQLDKKIYVAMAGEDTLPPKTKPTNDLQDRVMAFLTNAQSEMGMDKETAQKIASDPQQMAEIFSAGLQQISKQKTEMSRKRLSDTFGQMIQKMDDISGGESAVPLSAETAEAVSQMNSDLLGTMLSDNLEKVLENDLLAQVLQQVDDEKFTRLAAKFRFLQEKATASGGKAGTANPESIQQAYRLLMSSDRAETLATGIDERYGLEEAQRKQLATRLKTGLASIMKGQRYCFMDDQVMQSLPDTIEKLYTKGKSQTAEQIVERLCEGLADEEPDIGEAAAKVLAVIDQEIHPLAENAALKLKRYREKQKGGTPPAADAPPEISAISAVEAAAGKTPEADLSGYIDEADRMAQNGDIIGSVQYLAKAIARLATEKRFTEAKTLREKMMEIDPMALTEIVRTGELIEAEESGSIDSDFLDVWSHLSQQLTPEEINTLYYALREVSVDADHAIFKQGDLNTTLIFITQGELKLTCRQGDRDLLLANLEPGDIGGAETFFEYSVCTTTLSTLTTAKLNILDRKELDRWETDAPSLAAKIKDFCIGLTQTSDLLKQKGMDRRSYRRIELTGIVSIQVLGGKGAPVGKPFKGNLADISIGGLSFFIKTTKTETARLLLGRVLHLTFSLPTAGSSKGLKKRGRVIGVKLHPHSDCSVHVKFMEPLEEEMIEKLQGE